MKKIFHLIILIIGLRVNAQEKPQAITVTGFGTFEKFTPASNNIIDTKKLTRKIVSQEISLSQPLDILVEMRGLLNVKVWNENKVKIESGVWIEGNSELTDENWLDKVGISNKLSGNTVKVTIAQLDKFNYGSFVNYGLTYVSDRTRNISETVFKGDGSFLGNVTGNREATLYVPSTSKLEIQNKYGVLMLVNNIKNLSVLNTNGEINAQNIDNLQLHSSSGRFIAGVIRNGDINISHGRLYLEELTRGVLTTAYNTIEIQKLGDVQFYSASDEMDINESGSISGIKNYGSLLINVSGRLDLQGVNSRIKLRNIAPSTDLIRIFDMNTDLRIPIHEPKNYAVDVRGSFINLYSSWTDKTTTDTLTSAEVAAIKIRKDSLLALSKTMGSRNHVLAGGGGVFPGTRPERPQRDVYTAGSAIQITNENRLQSPTTTLKDTLIRQGATVTVTDSKLQSATPLTVYSERITTGTSIDVKENLANTTKTITIKDSFSTARNFKYVFVTGDAPIKTRFEIVCTNCTVDFK